MSDIRVSTETDGTIGIAADWRLDRSGALPSLVITIYLGDLAEIGGAGWQFDSLLSMGEETGTDLTLLYFPNGDSEGWDSGEAGDS
jgi:hypothetical protein